MAAAIPPMANVLSVHRAEAAEAVDAAVAVDEVAAAVDVAAVVAEAVEAAVAIAALHDARFTYGRHEIK